LIVDAAVRRILRGYRAIATDIDRMRNVESACIDVACGPHEQPACRCASVVQIEAIQLHHLGPGGDEVGQEHVA
jgi:hypothetical protein